MIRSALATIIILLFGYNFSFSQESAFQQRREQLEGDLNYLKLNAVQLYNLFPFSENGKFGVKNLKDEVVLPAIYDSIKPADPHRFIAVKGNRSQLFTNDLISCFDSSVVSIQLENWTYKVKDDKGGISQYTLVHHSNNLQPLDPKVNHLVYSEAYVQQPVKEAKAQLNTNTYVIDSNPYLDSIQIMYNSNASGDEEMFFYQQGRQVYKKTGDAYNYEVYANRFLCFRSGKSTSAFEIYDLKANNDFVVHASRLEPVVYNGKDCLLGAISTEDLEGLWLFDEQGKVIVEINESVIYSYGFLFKETAFDRQTMSRVYDMYSFPDMQLIDTDIRNPQKNYLGVFSTYNKAKDQFRFYFREKFIYEMSGKLFESIHGGGIYPNSGKGLILIKTKSKAKYRLITTDGKLVAEYKSGVRCYYEEQFGQIEIHVNRNTRAFSELIGVYDTISEEINFVPFPDFYWRRINANTLLYDFISYNRKNDTYSGEIYLMDLHGKRTDDRHFTDAKLFYEFNKVAFVMLEENGIPKVYDNEMNLVCDSCMLYNNPPFLVLYSDFDELKTTIIYEGVEQMFSGYLAVIPSNGYFIALTKERDIKYMPYDLKSWQE